MHKRHLGKIALVAVLALLIAALAGCAPAAESSSNAASASASSAKVASSATSSSSASASAASSSKASSSPEAQESSSSSASSSAAESDDAASASASSSSDSSASEKPQKVTFAIDGPVTVAYTGLYAAIANGYFDEENIEVEIVNAPSNGTDGLIGSGSANMGITSQDRIAGNMGAASPMAYTAVAAVVQHNTSGIMARVEDGITDVEQMSGKRYATRQTPVEQAIIRGLAGEQTSSSSASTDAEGNAEQTGVIMVPYSATNEVAGLQNNQYDCVWAFDWWAVSQANLLDYPVSFFDMSDLGPVLDYYTPVVAVNDKFATDNTDTVKAFLRALKRGYEFAVDYPSEAADILCDSVPDMNYDLVHLAQSYLSTEYIEDAPSWGVIDEGRWATFNQWLIDNNMVSYAFDPASGFSMDYLEQ